MPMPSRPFVVQAISCATVLSSWARGLRGLALIYALVFVLVSAGLGAAIYLATAKALAVQVDARLAGEISAVLGTGGQSALPDVRRRILQREGHRSTRDMSYLLIDGRARRVAGRIEMAMPTLGYSDVVFRDGNELSDEGRALAVKLAHGAKLAVVADSEPVEAFDVLLVQIFAVAFGAAILVGGLGGWALSAVIARRVAGINQTAEAIIDGDLSRRVPIDGSGDLFDRQALTLNRMLDRTAELMANLRQVTNDVAHDLRTPLSKLRNRLDAAARPGRQLDEVRNDIEQSVAEADGLLDLFAALLRISQIEAGARRAAFDWLDLGGLVREVCDTFAPALEDGGRRLLVRVDLPHVVHGDRELLTQMTVNLIENAERHTPPGTVVTLTIEERDAASVLSVADNGPGIGDTDPALLLRRFTRLDSSRSSDGHGLGLALVEAVAHLHDAEVALLDNYPGLRVEIAFPRREGWLG